MADEAEYENEYRPPDKQRRKSEEQLIMSPVLSTSSFSSDEMNDVCSDLPKNASMFKQVHLDKIGIFYPGEPESSFEKLLEKTKSCLVEIPELDCKCEIISDFLKSYLCFNVIHYKDHRVKEKLIQDMLNIHDNLRKLQKLTIHDFLVQSGFNKSKDLELVRMLETVDVGTMDFLEMVIYFMEEEAKSSGTFCSKMMHRELFSAFFKACGLSVRAGECVKNSIILNSANSITSEPDLRCKCNRQIFLRTDGIQVFNTLSQDTIMVGEVKRRKGERLHSDNFEISRDLRSYDVLGPMGAELFVELNETCFLKKEGGNRVVLGAICVGTQIIFTALEMSQDHFESIIECESDEVNLRRAPIHYTRPYDILKADDRQLLYKPIVRLACLQKRLSIEKAKI